jgi:hypothetical protein
MLDELQLRLVTYYSHSLNQPQASIGPLVVLTGGWASSLYTFTIQSSELSGASGKLPNTRGSGDSWLSLRTMAAAPSPYKRMTMLVPVGCGRLNRLADLVPALEATAF